MTQTPILILAGGRGARLGPLTCQRAKPAVPFGGRYRIVDFVLSNVLNSGYRRVYVLTQFMASSLIRHLNLNWQLSGMGEFIEVAPPQMRRGESWYQGTGDAVLQNLHLVDKDQAEHVGVFAGDHVCTFAIDLMEQFHKHSLSDLTVAAMPVPREQAHRFGVLQVDAQGRIVGFEEKPARPATIPGQPDECLISMGNYLFRYGVLKRALQEDALDSASGHDFGADIIPRLVREGYRVHAYDFTENQVPGASASAKPYWRDVGTIDGYFQSNMDLRAPLPPIDVYNHRWRIRTAVHHYPPARFVRHGAGPASLVEDSLVCEGSIVSSAVVRHSIVGYDCFVHAGAVVHQALVMSGCDVGAGARIRRAVLDKNCSLDPGAEIGFDAERDRERFPFTSPAGLIVIPKGTHVPRQGPIQLAPDVGALLAADPATRAALEACATAQPQRTSHHSVGPRYRRFGPEPGRRLFRKSACNSTATGFNPPASRPRRCRTSPG